jgi:hypothetical protein
MKRSLLTIVAALVVVAGPAQAKLVDLTASPNPATIGNQVRHTVNLGAPTRLELYVSAAGFRATGHRDVAGGLVDVSMLPGADRGDTGLVLPLERRCGPRLVPVRRGGADPRAVPVDGDHRRRVGRRLDPHRLNPVAPERTVFAGGRC